MQTLPESIKENAEWLYKQGWRNVFKWVNYKARRKSHLEGVDETLKGMRQVWGNIKDPWAYAQRVWSIREPHAWEREHQAKAELEKNDWEGLVNDLRELHRGK